MKSDETKQFKGSVHRKVTGSRKMKLNNHAN